MRNLFYTLFISVLASLGASAVKANPIVINSGANVVFGRVSDTVGNEIAGATVQIWDFFPHGAVFAEQTTDLNGSFEFGQISVVPFAVYAFAEGFYPGLLEDMNFGSTSLEIVLTSVSPVRPTNEWVNFFCAENLYKGAPLPRGSVVDAFDPDGVHVGSWLVTEAGSYGLMPVYRDDPFTEEDDGANPGDVIVFYINGIPAEATGDRVWTQNGDRFEVCLNFDGSVDKTICLKNGWNLISWNIDTEVDDISIVFGSFMQYVDVILGFEEVGLTYDPDLPEFSTLTSADHTHGYWVRIENFPGECVELNLAGLPVLVNAPIHLEAGWNLVSYLPTMSLPTGSALVSQEGNLEVALGFDLVFLTYDPDLPEFSTLTTMAPCFGYWLKVFEQTELNYPGFNGSPVIKPEEPTGQGQLPKPGMGVALTPFSPVQPTNEWVDFFCAENFYEGAPLPIGSVVDAFDPDGVHVGSWLVTEEGKYGLMPVYRDDPRTVKDDGAHPGDTITFYINGFLAEATGDRVWTQNGERFEVCLNFDSPVIESIPTLSEWGMIIFGLLLLGWMTRVFTKRKQLPLAT